MKNRRWINFILVPIGVLYSFLIISLPVINKFKDKIVDSGMIRDEFTTGNLQADVAWSGFESAIGIVLLLGVVMFLIYQKRNFKKSIISLILSSVIFICLSILFITPRIEKYSQNAAIEFFKSLSNKDVYVETLGYKSYAHFFYTKKKMPVNMKSYDKKWLLTGDIDKKAYFAMKIDIKEKILGEYPELEILYQRNGFVFCRRNPE